MPWICTAAVYISKFLRCRLSVWGPSAMLLQLVVPGACWCLLGAAFKRHELAALAVPLYNSLGESAVEYTVNHSETSIIFAEASKMEAAVLCLVELLWGIIWLCLQCLCTTPWASQRWSTP